MHDLLTRRILDNARLDGVGDGRIPLRLDLVHRRIHADAVDLPVGRERTNDHRHVVFSTEPVDDIREQECFTLRFVDAADKLPAHKRMKL